MELDFISEPFLVILVFSVRTICNKSFSVSRVIFLVPTDLALPVNPSMDFERMFFFSSVSVVSRFSFTKVLILFSISTLGVAEGVLVRANAFFERSENSKMQKLKMMINFLIILLALCCNKF